MTHILSLQQLGGEPVADSGCVLSKMSCPSDQSCLSYSSNPVQTQFAE